MTELNQTHIFKLFFLVLGCAVYLNFELNESF